jgi:hypothetical protein
VPERLLDSRNGPRCLNGHILQTVPIEQVKPDDKGFRTVKYGVRLTFHDQQGHVTKVENFNPLDRIEK